MEYTPLPVIDVSQSKTQEDFNRNYNSRIQNAHPDEGNHQNEQNQMAVITATNEEGEELDRHFMTLAVCIPCHRRY